MFWVRLQSQKTWETTPRVACPSEWAGSLAVRPFRWTAEGGEDEARRQSTGNGERAGEGVETVGEEREFEE